MAIEHLTLAVSVAAALWTAMYLALYWAWGNSGMATLTWLFLTYLYRYHWRPQSWTWWRSSDITHRVLYNLPVEVHGPNAKFNLESHPDRKYVLACHPHGVFPFGVEKYFMLSGNFLGMRACVHWMLAEIPILKECAGWAGCIKADRDLMAETLAKDEVRGLLVTPGGIKEGLLMEPRSILMREGYLKIAMKQGAYIVPVWDATVDDLYDFTLPLGDKYYRALGHPWPVMSEGKAWYSPWPKEVTHILVIGDPIPTQGMELGELKAEVEASLKELRKTGNRLREEKLKTCE